MKTIIVDDEALGRLSLKKLVTKYCPELDIIGEAANIKGAVELIETEKPELVFLDIEMPEIPGIQIYDYLPEELVGTFQIVFTTAHADYAVNAFRVNATDYLLKPISIKNLKEAVGRALEVASDNSDRNKKEEAKQLLDTKLLIPYQDGCELVDISNIMYFKAAGSYTHVMLEDGRDLLVSKKLAHFSHMDGKGGFFKNHRSYIVNTAYVRRFSKGDNPTLILMNDGELPLSKNKRHAFEEMFLS